MTLACHSEEGGRLIGEPQCISGSAYHASQLRQGLSMRHMQNEFSQAGGSGDLDVCTALRCVHMM